MQQWRFAVLELYQVMDFHADGEVHPKSWPAEGTPAKWIEDNLVGYTDGDVRDFVSHIPLWKILVWRVMDALDAYCEC